MNKGTHFIGQPLYCQLINLLDKSKILVFSRNEGGERYVKHFNGWQHLVVMLYAVIKRFDSLREISFSMLPEARKLAHLGISMMPRRSTLSDANARRPECVFEKIYRDLYASYRDELSSDSRKHQTPQWLTGFKYLIQQRLHCSPTSFSKVWDGIRRWAGRKAASKSIQLFMPMRVFPLTYSILLQRRMTASCSGLHNMPVATSLP